MAKKKVKEVVVDRIGFIRDNTPLDGLRMEYKEPPFSESTRRDYDIARAAVRAGYKVGRKLRIRIFIEPER
jgi:hypothetical protein